MKSIQKGSPPTGVIINPYSVEEAFLGNYFFGQTEFLHAGEGSYAWGGLINPANSGVHLYWNVYTISNFSGKPFTAEIWLNSSLAEKGKRSVNVTSSNQSLTPLPQPMIELKYADRIQTPPVDGIFSFLRRVEPNTTLTRHDFQGLIILPQGGSAIVLIRPSGQIPVQAQIAFGWWEQESPGGRSIKK